MAITTPKLLNSKKRTGGNPGNKPTCSYNTRLIESYIRESKDLLAAEKTNIRLTLALEDHRERRLRLEENFNIRGALERIVYQHQQMKKPKYGSVGIQPGIDRMAALPEFQDILDEEAKARKLEPENVKSCVSHIYHTLSKHAHGNNGNIVIRHRHHTRNEVAALVAIFKVQDTWEPKVVWSEDPTRER
ncbi:hypothetical protein HOY82DRAFT_537033 [Tuber indicum]|nr:hypothetical protein HOY82DRAFT_537033 [Tuber indicum]